MTPINTSGDTFSLTLPVGTRKRVRVRKPKRPNWFGVAFVAIGLTMVFSGAVDLRLHAALAIACLVYAAAALEAGRRNWHRPDYNNRIWPYKIVRWGFVVIIPLTLVTASW